MVDLVDSDGDVEGTTVPTGMGTEGLLAEAAGAGASHPEADDYTGVEIMDSVLAVVSTVAIVDVTAGGVVVSIDMETAGAGDDAGLFTGVEREQVHSGKPHTNTKLKWGGIGKYSFFFFYQISEI